MSEPARRHGAVPDPSAPTDDEPPARPASPLALFVAFTALALQGFGGVLPVAQQVLVERRRWLTRAQFVELLALAQVLPGPNVVNLALMVGDRFHGTRGAFAALAGMLVVPTLIVLALAALYARFATLPAVAGALRGMGAVAAGLVIASGWNLLPTLKSNPLGQPLALAVLVATLVAMAALRWPLVAVVLGLGGVSVALAAWRLRR
jgi:chromate transporter